MAPYTSPLTRTATKCLKGFTPNSKLYQKFQVNRTNTKLVANKALFYRWLFDPCLFVIIIIMMIIVVETKIEHSNFLSSSTDFEMHTKIVNVLVRVFWVCVPQNCF